MYQSKQDIPIFEAQRNDSYWNVTKKGYKNWAATVIQRRWRESSQNKSYDSPIRPFWENENNSNALIYSKKIHACQWNTLNFQDVFFVRDMFKAFRLNYITCEQMKTALMLQNASEEFNPATIRQFEFSNPRGALKLEDISIAKDEQILDFCGNLKKLPLADQCYFSINLSSVHETEFFISGLLDPYQPILNKKFYRLFLYYIDQLILKSPENKERFKSFLSHINYFRTPNNLKDMQKHNEVTKEFISLVRKITHSKTMQQSASMQLLTRLWVIENDFLFIVLSPDNNDNRLGSPIVSIVMPTYSALNLFQKCFFGKDAVNCIFTTAPITTREIRSYAENIPYERPVEVIHPDIKWKNSADGYDDLGKFTYELHDVFHVFSASLNPYKRLINYLNRVFTEVTGFDMSKSIWDLIDITRNHSWKALRIARFNKKPELLQLAIQQCLHQVFTKIDNTFISDTNEKATNLIIIISMILNSKTWIELLENSPQEIFKQEQFKCLQEVLIKMEKIVEAHKKKDLTSGLIKYFILKYQFFEHEQGSQLCDLLGENVNKIFFWKKQPDNNCGLCFKYKEEIFEADVQNDDVFYNTLYKLALPFIDNLENYNHLKPVLYGMTDMVVSSYNVYY